MPSNIKLQQAESESKTFWPHQNLACRYMSGWTDNQTAQNMTFKNYRSPGMAAFAPCARCLFPELRSIGVRFARVAGIEFMGEGMPVEYPTSSDGVLLDADGSMTGLNGKKE